MWSRTHTKQYEGIRAEDIWKALTDVNHWASWQDDLDYCKMDGEFKVGNHFILKPKGAPKVHIDILEVDIGRRFVDCTKFFGAKMYNTHSIEETSDGVRITDAVAVSGILKWFWIKIVAQRVADTADAQMDALVQFVRERTK